MSCEGVGGGSWASLLAPSCELFQETWALCASGQLRLVCPPDEQEGKATKCLLASLLSVRVLTLLFRKY